MSTTLTVMDQMSYNFGSGTYAFSLDLGKCAVSVRELIERRIQQEVNEYNSRRPDFFRGLIQPSDAERTRHGFRLRQQRTIDWQTQFHRALDSFRANGFILLVNERQVIDLEETIEINPETSIIFLKLIPLVGG